MIEQMRSNFSYDQSNRISSVKFFFSLCSRRQSDTPKIHVQNGRISRGYPSSPSLPSTLPRSKKNKRNRLVSESGPYICKIHGGFISLKWKPSLKSLIKLESGMMLIGWGHPLGLSIMLD